MKPYGQKRGKHKGLWIMKKYGKPVKIVWMPTKNRKLGRRYVLDMEKLSNGFNWKD